MHDNVAHVADKISLCDLLLSPPDIIMRPSFVTARSAATGDITFFIVRRDDKVGVRMKNRGSSTLVSGGGVRT
jgi:hypothetical protein